MLEVDNFSDWYWTCFSIIAVVALVIGYAAYKLTEEWYG